MLVLFLFLTQVGTLITRLSKDAILSQLLKLDQTQQDQAVSMTQKIHLAFSIWFHLLFQTDLPGKRDLSRIWSNVAP